MNLLFHGNFIHVVNGKLEILENKYITVINGKINSISDKKPDGEYEVYDSTDFQIILPGLIDTHIHAPQYAFLGCGLDLPLMEWLNKYTFPAESKFTDIEHAKRVYNAVVNKSLSFGTTTASYFATIHSEASLLLADVCRKCGQRAFVGKVTMDQHSPSFYIEKTDDAIKSVNKFVNDLMPKNDNDLVQPIITPRFVPTCSMESMKGLAKIMEENPFLLAQSHLSENLDEIARVKELHPQIQSYSHVYDEAGLLSKGRGALMAHAVHLTDEEIALLAERKCSIAHCPSSNFQVFSGLCDIRRLQKGGINVSLGTDVAGGESISMIHAMRNALVCSRSIMFEERNKGNNGYQPITVAEAFALATECGAKALHIDDKVGNFIIGKDFDAIIVDMNTGSTDCFGNESLLDLLDKFVHAGDDRNIIRVYVQGKLVKKI